MTNAQVIAELTRAKVLFQVRAIAAALGVSRPTNLPPSPAPDRLQGEDVGV